MAHNGQRMRGLLVSVCVVLSLITLATAACVMVLLFALNRHVRLKLGDEADVTPGVQLPDMAIAVEPLPDDGPVIIQLEYRIDADNLEKNRIVEVWAVLP